MYPGPSAILQQGAALQYDMLPTQSIGNSQGNLAPVHKTIHRVIQHADTVLIRTNSTCSNGQISSKTEGDATWNEEYTFHGTILQGQQFGPYRLIRQIGQGGYANIYLGEHIRSNSRVALKMLNCFETNEDEVECFRREAHLHASMRHQHIVPLLDFGWEKDTPFLVMRYAPGGTLQQYFPLGRPLPLHTILPAVLEIASALQYIHNRDLVHCDIKPENVLVGAQNGTWLTDFGIATSVAGGDRYGGHELRGTARYSAPEQIVGNPLPASDQYALAVMVYQWLCGQCPFSGTPLTICFQHLQAPPPRLRDQVPSISYAVEQVVLKALSKDPRRRFAQVSEFAHALLKEAVQVERRYEFFASPASPFQSC
jgi:serine/threonine protein kinase